MSLKRLFTITLGIVLLAGLSFFTVKYFFNSKIAYVNIDQVYNSFPLKVELEKKLQASQKQRENLLDSLKSDLRLLSMDIESNKSKDQNKINLFYLKREELSEKEQKFTQESEMEVENYKSQIWKQLGQYISDYGKAKGYDYIFGVDDSYVMLYCDQANNITEDMKSYVNGKYQGTLK